MSRHTRNHMARVASDLDLDSNKPKGGAQHGAGLGPSELSACP